MPLIDIPEVRLHYRIDGREDAPWLVLSNSLGTTLDLWEPQMPALLPHFRVLRYDARGHGESSVPPGPYTIDQLGNDVIALMDGLGIARAHFCGLSMGGVIGIWLGIHQAARIDRLVLCNTAAKIGTAESWRTRIAKVEQEGMAGIVETVLDRWFTPGYTERAPQDGDKGRAMLLAVKVDGYIANCVAVRDMDQREQVPAITVPTLVIAGTHDQTTPPEEGRMLAQHIPGARYVELDSAHLSNREQSGQFTANLLAFLNEGGMHMQ